MTADPKVFELFIDPDARLAAAAGGVARYILEAAGLESKEACAVQKSVVAACLEAFKLLNGTHPHLTVTTTRFFDRIEVAVAYPTSSSVAGRSAPVNAANTGALQGIDRVQREAHDGLAVTRLTKFVGNASHE